MGYWKCKKCGGEIIADCSNGAIDGGYGIINKDKEVELVNYSIDFDIDNIYCEECGNSSDNLEDIAEWEDEQMIKVGDKVKIKDSYISFCIIRYCGEFEVVEIRDSNTCIISDGKEKYVAFIGDLELKQEDKFNLVEFLKENLKPKEFEAGECNNYFYFNMKDNEWYVSYNHYFQEIKTYFSNINYDFANTLNENKVTPKELKEAYKTLGWL